MTVVLEDGSFRIEWNGSYTFSVHVLGREIDLFSTDYTGDGLTEAQARDHAAEWWADGGKTGAQEAVREFSKYAR